MLRVGGGGGAARLCCCCGGEAVLLLLVSSWKWVDGKVSRRMDRRAKCRAVGRRSLWGLWGRSGGGGERSGD